MSAAISTPTSVAVKTCLIPTLMLFGNTLTLFFRFQTLSKWALEVGSCLVVLLCVVRSYIEGDDTQLMSAFLTSSFILGLLFSVLAIGVDHIRYTYHKVDRLAKQLQRSKAQQANLLDSGFDAVFSLDMSNLSIWSSNNKCDLLFGKSMQGCLLKDSVSQDLQKELQKFLSDACEVDQKNCAMQMKHMSTFHDTLGHEFDAELRAVSNTWKSTIKISDDETLLIGLRLVGERRVISKDDAQGISDANGEDPRALNPQQFGSNTTKFSNKSSSESSISVEHANTKLPREVLNSSWSWIRGRFAKEADWCRNKKEQSHASSSSSSHKSENVAIENLVSFMFHALTLPDTSILQCAWMKNANKSLQITRTSKNIELYFGATLEEWPVECIFMSDQHEKFRTELQFLVDKASTCDEYPEGYSIHDFGVFTFETILLGGGTLEGNVRAVHCNNLRSDSKAVIFLCLQSLRPTRSCHTTPQRSNNEGERSDVSPEDSASNSGRECRITKRLQGSTVPSIIEGDENEEDM
eukprot:gnl/MRDRNA2_/MRDRNA2_40815_c0_seq1.p1 gnl/MRDRNA2_/MRDRNA2_40815_c0~~gnl/MRDRNA2_/MRDRNA2_40815_c0_seq1.p1  ORF type:complete len:543 (+),score=68.18 gnl/MRDRNA2_/MRDRNA2_40815_c0_seq1:61-1629(+)